MAPGVRLTNEEKVMLHLMAYHRYRDATEAPTEVTQEGMRKSLGITQSHVSYAVKSLKERGDVEEVLSHVKGVKRRRKAYWLTRSGYSRGKGLHERLASTKVMIINKEGRSKTVELGKAQGVTGTSMLRLTEMVGDSNTIDLRVLEEAKDSEDSTKEERDEMEEFIDNIGSLFELGISSTARAVKGGVDIVERVGKGSVQFGKDAAKRTARKARKVTERLLGKKSD